MSLHMLGRIGELTVRSSKALANARELGQLQAETSLRVLGIALGHLANDDVAKARAEAAWAAEAWPERNFHAEHLRILRLTIWCDLYAGEPDAAYEALARAQTKARGSQLLDSPYWRYWWLDLTASAALAKARVVRPEQTNAFCAEAQQAVTQLEALNPGYAQVSVPKYRACLLSLTSRREDALDALRLLAQSPHPQLSAVAQLRLGQALDSPDLTQLGERRLGGSVASPERWASWLLPGLSEPPR